jgi:hypothetical protein
MHVMLVCKTDQEEGRFGKHYLWELRGHMSSSLMKLKAQGDFRNMSRVCCQSKNTIPPVGKRLVLTQVP